MDYERLGEFEKSLEYFDKAIRASPHDPELAFWYGGKAWANFGLKRYDQAIELARQAIAINPNYVPGAHMFLVAALALTGHDAEAREALQRYLALPSTGPLKTIAAWKAHDRVPARRSALRRDARADVRRPAQSRDAGGVSGRDSGEGGLDARQGLPLRAVKPISRSQWNAGYGHSGPSRVDPFRPALRPI